MSRRLLVWCATLVVGLVVISLYARGTELTTLFLIPLALVCPVLVGWLYFRYLRPSSGDESGKPIEVGSLDERERQ